MWSVEAIHQVNEEHAVAAKLDGRTPRYFNSREDVERVGGSYSLPFLGYHVPEGYELVDTFMFYPWERWGTGRLIQDLQAWFDRGLEEGQGYGFAGYEQHQFTFLVGVYRWTG